MKKIRAIIDKIAPRKRLAKLQKSIWLFPIILTAILLLLTIFKISGSSIGVYHTIFNGHTNDSSLLFGKPREIRADEWIVNTQMIIAQKNNNLEHINQNIGNGQDMSVVIDVPYKDWSQLFRPQNWSFFVLPFDFAFAFKWWLLAYLLMLSCYFFVLALLPGKRLLAASLSIALLFGAMIQWWYQFITIAPIYYSLFLATAIIMLVRTQRQRHGLLWGALIAYLATCFVLVLYPPFQIACALALAAFITGYLLQALRKIPRKIVLQKLGVLGAAVLISGALVLLFVHTRSAVIHTITNTAYPGERVIASGGFDAAHIFSGHLGFLFQSMSKAKQYQINDGIFLNQSEASNFILLLPFLLLPSLYIIVQDLRYKRKTDWPLISVNFGFIFMLAWMLIPHLNILGKPFMLEKVQLIRLLLGLGLLNLFQLVLIIRRLSAFSGRFTGRGYIAGYAVLVFLIQLALGILAMNRAPGFIVLYQVIILALPVPIIIYLLLRKHITLAVVGLAAFSIFTTCLVNPLYRGTEILTQTSLTKAIQEANRQQPGTWIADTIYLENFATLSGARTISGVYTYPQLDIWRSLDDGTKEDIYNRYAHVSFALDRNSAVNVPTRMELPIPDHFDIITEPCGAYLKEKEVRYILTAQKITEPCVELAKTVSYPAVKVFIYKFR